MYTNILDDSDSIDEKIVVEKKTTFKSYSYHHSVFYCCRLHHVLINSSPSVVVVMVLGKVGTYCGEGFAAKRFTMRKERKENEERTTK